MTRYEEGYSKYYSIRLFRSMDNKHKEYLKHCDSEKEELRFMRLIGINSRNGYQVIYWSVWWQDRIPF